MRFGIGEPFRWDVRWGESPARVTAAHAGPRFSARMPEPFSGGGYGTVSRRRGRAAGPPLLVRAGPRIAVFAEERLRGRGTDARREIVVGGVDHGRHAAVGVGCFRRRGAR